MKLGKLVFVWLLCSAVVGLGAQTPRKHATGAGNRDQESVQEVGKLEEEMRLAILKGTAGWWVEHLSEGYIGTDSRGKVTNRAETIELQRSAQLIYDTWNLSDRAVHIFNSDTVIVTGKVAIEGKYREQSLSGDFQFTRVWVKNRLVWELAASQMTKI